MRTLFLTAVLGLFAVTTCLADSVTATVGHMCCGSCKTAATAGVKSLSWVDGVTITDTTVTATSKADQKVDVVAFVQALDKSGFPATNIAAATPVTLSVAHLCCPNCVTDLKAKLDAVRSQTLDKMKIVIDDKAKTVTVQPVEGKTLNLVQVLRQMATAGFSASKGTIATK